MYAVTVDESNDSTYVTSLDVSDPGEVRLAGLLPLPRRTEEIHLDDRALFVAQRMPRDEWGWAHDTHVVYVDLASPSGELAQRGAITLAGAPQGRFHMDATADQLRIVTYEEEEMASILHVVDLRDPDHLVILGRLEGLAPGERLHATRFAGDLAYVVTFQQIDPLWVIDLSDPTRPTVVGELEVPGWSDYIFPRENGRLLTVGRGPQMGIAVSLFDVSDPTRPVQLDTVEIGTAATQSEAISDFRGAHIVEPGVLGAAGLVAIPSATEGYDEKTSQWGCEPRVHLVDLEGDTLRARGSVLTDGGIRRSFPLGGRLLVLTDLELRALDVSDRDAPGTTSTLTLGNPDTAPYACEWTDSRVWGGPMGRCGTCCATGTGPAGLGALALALVALVVVRRR